jgi:hypothetical protein
MQTARPIALLLVAAASAAGGCRFMTQPDAGATATRPPAGAVPQQTAENLVGFLNRQAGYMQTLSYGDVTLRSSENGSSNPKLADTTLFVQQPRNLRLIAGHSIAGKQIDIGSNDREFWLYAKPQPGDNFFYCTHEDFAKGQAALPIPFDTEWVMQALNMHSYPDPTTGQYTVETKGREYVLTQRTATRNGTPITKVTVFNYDNQDGRLPVVSRHRVQDDRGQVLAAAEIRKTKVKELGTDKATGKPARVQVPTEVTLEWPQQRFRMDLTLGDERVNEDLGDRQAKLFERPTINGTHPIDLATYRFSPTARGQAPGRESRRVVAWPDLPRR